MGIVGEEPIGANGYNYHKVTFDTAGGTMEYPVRYFLDGGNISNQIVPDFRAGYTFGGWYNGKDLWDHANDKVTGDMTLTAHWTVCDHSGHTGAKPTCTTSVICTACGGTIAALGHNFSMQHDNDEHWNKCSRCDAIDGKKFHDWDNGVITVSATCMKAGKKTYTCTECRLEKIESIQASGHNWGREWQHDPTHHWHDCLNSYCDVKERSQEEGYGAHTGGTATCMEKAKCEVCGESYGDLDHDNHAGGTEQWTTRDAASHEKKWSCCGAVIVASEPHEWSNGECSECGYVCAHDDTDKNHICDLCGKIISNHKDGNKDHKCDLCGKLISNHEDTSKDHKCDLCGKLISNHKDGNNDHKCDLCGKLISNHEDGNNDHKCDLCGKVISNHTGGTATCKGAALCEICGKSYGGLAPDNHTNLIHVPAKAATKSAEGNTEYWYCDGCDRYYGDAAATRGITKADTVTEKLPDESKSPQTAGQNSLVLWIALLFISGGVLAGAAVAKKKSGSVE